MKRLLALLLSLLLVLSFSASAETTPRFSGMNDPALLQYIEDDLYEGLVSTLDSEEYFVENVQAVYISQEYLDEVAYNSQANVFFGFTLAELEAQFEGEGMYSLSAMTEQRRFSPSKITTTPTIAFSTISP